MPGRAYVEEVQGQVAPPSLTELQTLIQQIQTSVGELQDSIVEQFSPMPRWSDQQEEVQLTAAGGTVALPSVTVTKIPTNATVTFAITMFKFRAVENINALANALNGAQAIQIRVDTPGPWTNAINFINGEYGLVGTAREGSDVAIGSIDVSDIVVGNDIYEFQWLNGRANLDFINFNDIQMGLYLLYSM